MQQPYNANLESKTLPITVNYHQKPNEERDYRFIQSVSIINGYNVSLGEHNTLRARHD